MNEPTATGEPFVLVDSNIVIDIVQQDPKWVDWSVEALSRTGNARVNPVIYAELCYQQTSVEEVDRLLESLSIGFDELPRESLFLASQAYRVYRRSRGAKTAPLPDFFIGAHATVSGASIITRDVNRYRTYFPTVTLISP